MTRADIFTGVAKNTFLQGTVGQSVYTETERHVVYSGDGQTKCCKKNKRTEGLPAAQRAVFSNSFREKNFSLLSLLSRTRALLASQQIHS